MCEVQQTIVRSLVGAGCELGSILVCFKEALLCARYLSSGEEVGAVVL